jgi:hypothetical protein
MSFVQAVNAEDKPAQPADQGDEAAGKPFLWALADIEGRPVVDECCVAESPGLLEECHQDEIDNLAMKIVPVYTGPQIETLRARVERAESSDWFAEYVKLHRDFNAAIAQRDKARAEVEALKGRKVVLPTVYKYGCPHQEWVYLAEIIAALRAAGIAVEGES